MGVQGDLRVDQSVAASIASRRVSARRVPSVRATGTRLIPDTAIARRGRNPEERILMSDPYELRSTRHIPFHEIPSKAGIGKIPVSTFQLSSNRKGHI